MHPKHSRDKRETKIPPFSNDMFMSRRQGRVLQHTLKTLATRNLSYLLDPPKVAGVKVATTADTSTQLNQHPQGHAYLRPQEPGDKSETMPSTTLIRSLFIIHLRLRFRPAHTRTTRVARHRLQQQSLSTVPSCTSHRECTEPPNRINHHKRLFDVRRPKIRIPQPGNAACSGVQNRKCLLHPPAALPAPSTKDTIRYPAAFLACFSAYSLINGRDPYGGDSTSPPLRICLAAVAK